MPKEEWGTKRLCPTTGKRFYDLNRNPVVSPYTGETVDTQTGKSRMIEADAEDVATAKAKPRKEGDKAPAEEQTGEVELDDDILEDDEDDEKVSLDELTDVASDEDDT